MWRQYKNLGIRTFFILISPPQIQTIKHHIKPRCKSLPKALLTAPQNQLKAQTVGQNCTSVHCFPQLLNKTLIMMWPLGLREKFKSKKCYFIQYRLFQSTLQQENNSVNVAKFFDFNYKARSSSEDNSILYEFLLKLPVTAYANKLMFCH